MTSSAMTSSVTTSSTPAPTSSTATPDTSSILLQFMGELLSGRLRVVDLTQTLTPEFPTIVMPPELGQAWPFRVEEISRYDERGPAWYWNNFSCSEHTGTHFDAPVHWISGKDLPNNAVDSIPVENFIAQACVIDVSAQCRENADFLLTVDLVREWEHINGRIPERAWVLMRTDWSKHDTAKAYLNIDEEGPHSPGPDAEVVPWLVRERNVHGFGTESVGTDAGQSHHLNPPYPCHYFMHGNNRYGLQCLTNLDLLPPQGTVIFAAPLKIRHGSGSPLRVLALVPTGDGGRERRAP